MYKGREISDYIGDILAAITEIEEFTRGMSFVEFSSDRKTTNAVIRSLEVFGEATKHIPSSFRNKHSEIPWSKMAGMRDVLIHDYMGVDLKTVWKVIQERLPELKIIRKKKQDPRSKVQEARFKVQDKKTLYLEPLTLSL